LEAERPTLDVVTLQTEGWLLVEDGNHGEYRPRPEEFGTGVTAFVRAADLDNGRVLFESAERINETGLARIRKGIGKGGDILFSHKGTVGKLALVPLDSPPFVCSPQTTFWRVLDHRKVDRHFLYAFMRSDAFTEQWQARKGETDMADYVSLTAQRTFRVPVPPIEEQREIGKILGALDEKIEVNRQMSRALEATAQALFKSWFVDFDPVTARMSDRPLCWMNASLTALFAHRFNDSPIGAIPEGWRVSRVKDEYRLTMGQSPPGSTYNLNAVGPPFYQGRVDFGFRFPSRRVFCTAPTRVAELDDTLVTVRAPVGSVNLAKEACAIGRGVAAVRHRSGSSSFTYYAMRSLGDEFGAFEGDGTLFGAIGRADFEGIQIVAPLDPVISAFQDLVGPMDERIRANEAESEIIERLRDILLPRLLSGEIRLRDAEKAVEGAGA